MVKRIISVLGIFVILFSNCLSVYADIVDSGSYISSNFWDFLSGNEYDYNLNFWKNVTGYFVGKECPSSPDSYHHGPKPAFGSSSGGSDENGRFGWATCEYCGNPFKVYSSFTPNASGFGKSDLQQSYEAQVEELPATGYNSGGRIIWQPTLANLSEVVVYKGRGGYSPSPVDSDLYTVFYSGSTITVNLDCENWPASTSLFIYVSFSDFPIVGSYGAVRDSYVFLRRLSSSGKYIDLESFSSISTTFYHYKPDSVSGLYEACSFSSSPYGYLTAAVTFSLPRFEVIPDIVPSGDIYNITTRPTSITGDYGIIGDNGQIIKVEGDKIVNETNNTIYNPATGQTTTITDWSYNYEDRSYTVTTEAGDTVTITYGDENVTIKEDDTIYNIYYLVDSGSGAPGPDVPGGCNHDWTETSRTDPSCSTPGKVTFTCSKCSQPKTETIPATGHAWVIDRTVQTTYDEEGNLLQQGYTIYSCSVCGEQYKDMEGIGPPGPSDGDNSGDSGLIEFLDGLIKSLSKNLHGAVELILSFFQEVPAMFSGFLAFLTAMFPFLPPEIMTLLTFGIAAVVFIGIIKAIRR